MQARDRSIGTPPCSGAFQHDFASRDDAEIDPHFLLVVEEEVEEAEPPFCLPGGAPLLVCTLCQEEEEGVAVEVVSGVVGFPSAAMSSLVALHLRRRAAFL